MPMTIAYPVTLRIRGTEFLVLWVDGGSQSDFIVRDGKKILTARNREEIRRDPAAHEYKISPQRATCDFDQALKFINKMMPGMPSSAKDCALLLNSWNMLEDIIRTIGITPRKNSKRIYNMLYRGCNLPAVTPNGKEYAPSWSRADIRQLNTRFSALLATIDSKAPYLFAR